MASVMVGGGTMTTVQAFHGQGHVSSNYNVTSLTMVGMSGDRYISGIAGCSAAQRGKSWRVLAVRSQVAGQTKSPAETEWKIKRDKLLRNRVRSVKAKDALRLQQEDGYVILDVRLENEYKEAHPKGAINVQIYRLIKEWTAWHIIRRLAFAFFGIFQGTEENPEFVNEVKAKLDKNSKVIVVCITGGTLKPTPNFAEGQQSRSLIAAYLLILEGYSNVLHLEGGLQTWFKEGLPTVED